MQHPYMQTISVSKKHGKIIDTNQSPTNKKRKYNNTQKQHKANNKEIKNMKP